MNHLQHLQKMFGSGEGRALYRMVMEERFGLSQTDLLLCKDTELSTDEQEELSEIVSRLLKNEPIQYILGYADFCGHRFCVRPGCLIPRPETQELVRMIVQNSDAQIQNYTDAQIPHSSAEVRRKSVLDIGTGSGCIAISLAMEGFRVTAMDISDEALAVASENANRLGTTVNLIKENILHPTSVVTEDKWNIIVSNPPYICECEAKDMDRNVLDYEPHLALFVPDINPLLFYQKIAEFGLKHLEANGFLYFEINPIYNCELTEMLTHMGYRNVKTIKDQYDKIRFATAQL